MIHYPVEAQHLAPQQPRKPYFHIFNSPSEAQDVTPLLTNYVLFKQIKILRTDIIYHYPIKF